jgi:hypothetical protein
VRTIIRSCVDDVTKVENVGAEALPPSGIGATGAISPGIGAGGGVGTTSGALAQETGTSNNMTSASPIISLFITKSPPYYHIPLYYNAEERKRLGGLGVTKA